MDFRFHSSRAQRGAKVRAASTDVLETTILADQVHDLLRARILSQELKPGQRISVTDLCAEFKVSSTPIKTALHRLSVEGFVVVIPRGGTYVAQFDEQKVAESFDIRLILEMYAAEQGLDGVGETFLRRMRSLVDDTRKSLYCADRIDYELVQELDNQFHRNIVGLAANSTLNAIYANLHLPIWIIRARYLEREPRIPGPYEEHLAIVQALEARDAAAVRRAITDHLTAVKSFVLDVLGQA